MSPRRAILIYVATAIAGVFAVLIAIVLFMDWDLLKGPIARVVSAKTGRTVTITGHLHAHLWSTTPTLSVEGVQVADPAWDVPRPLLQLKRLQVQVELRPLFSGHLVLRRLEVDEPDLYLHQESSGRANWTNDNTAPTSATRKAAKPFNLPAIHELVIQSGTLALLDDARKLRIKGAIDAHEHSAVEDPKAMHILARGTINTRPFALEVTGGALLAVNPEHPYPFKLSIKAADNQIDAEGRILKPFDLGQLDLQVAAHGPDLAELFYLTQLALPNTPPYQLQAQISRDGQHFVVRDIKGKLGRSDIGGNIDIDASHNRPMVSATLSSDHLYLSDLGAVTGSRAGAGGALDQSDPEAPAAPVALKAKGEPTMLFPDAHLQTNRIRAMDADVQFKATSIEAGKIPFKQVDLHAKLKDGVLALDPVQFVLPEGHVSGVVNIDARADPPQVHMDVRATDVDLEQLKGSGPASAAPLGGLLQARAVIKGRGDSLHNVMADADGSFAAVIPHGDIRSAFAELTGIDLSGLGLLLTQNEKRAPIRCGVARFDVSKGTAQAQSIVLDTQNVLITGSGKINLGNERLDLQIKGEPKKFHLVRVRAPIDIKGLLTKPSFQPDKGQLLKQGGVAAALGTLLTPVAAIVAFIDPGLAKDADCSRLLAQAHTEKGAPPKGATAKPQAASAR